MVELTVRLSSKAQMVVPKLIRDAYNLYPNSEVSIITEEDGFRVKQKRKGIAQELKKMAEAAAKKRDGRKIEIHPIEEQYEERARRAGIKV